LKAHPSPLAVHFMVLTDACLQEAQARLQSRDLAEYMVPEARMILAWKLGDLTAVRSMADTHAVDELGQDRLKDILARTQDPQAEASDEEVFEAYITSCCDDDLLHPDEAWDEFVPECDGEEPSSWSFDPNV